MTDCAGYQVLEISDGETTVNLLDHRSGFFVTDWQMAVADAKGGGAWSDSQLVDGRKLRLKRRQNVRHTMEVQVHAYSPDVLIRNTRDLRRLLEKAAAYSPVNWQDGPVWIKRQGRGESNPTYILIEDYSPELITGFQCESQDDCGHVAVEYLGYYAVDPERFLVYLRPDSDISHCVL